MSTLAAPKTSRALPPLLHMTERAAERLRALYAQPGAKKFLRIGVRTRGCSGLAYEMSYIDEPGANDEVVNDRGLTVLVDRKASLFLIGTTMDYTADTLSSGFTFKNPNEKGRCGCGESFHV